ncbi:MAG: protein kinase [Planctomycetota bacterium]|nr:protein kinase [Planctomycetota bacterium]
MQVDTVEQMVELLHRSKLLTSEQLSQIAALEARDAEQLVRRMFRRGWLTRWQALTLLEGRCQFTIGRYTLLELIGTGGMGAVFKAVRPEIGRVVAVKVLKPKVLRKSSGIPRFLREIRSAASLDHPNIVQAYDADKVDGTYVLVMEYVHGRDLKSYITDKVPMSIPWLCECMRQAAQGMQHAADRGTVHRDIKPANLMVTSTEPDGPPIVKILDFGLARFASETEEDEGLTRVGQAVGTPDYISPEQAQNSRSADVRADIYSLGCTFFELLTGQVPFPIENLTEKLVARVRFDAPRVSSLRPDIPPEIDAIVARMMARNPADRYQTPLELARALVPFALSTGQVAGDCTGSDSGSSSDWEVQNDSVYGRFLDNLNEAVERDENGVVTVKSAAGSVAVSDPPPSSHTGRRPTRKSVGPLAVGVAVAAFAWIAILLFLFAPPKQSVVNPRGGRLEPQVGGAEAEPIPETSGRAAAKELLALGATLLATTTSNAPGAVKWPGPPDSDSPRWVVEINNEAQLPRDADQIVGIEFRQNDYVTNMTLERITELPGIEQLILIGCKLTDSGLENLGKLPKIRVLNLSGMMAISDLGMRHLKSLEHLEDLTLNQVAFNGEGLAHLSHLSRIRRLNLDYTRVSGPALRHLESFKNLEVLSLNGNKIPPGALAMLEPLDQLKELSLSSTSLSEQAVSNLVRRRPNLKVKL